LIDELLHAAVGIRLVSLVEMKDPQTITSNW